MSTSHPDHDVVAAEVRSWYTDWRGRAPGPAGSDPAMNIRVERAWYGYLRATDAVAGGRLLLTVDDPDEAKDAIQSAASFFGSDRFDIWIDDRTRAAALEPVLVAHGRHAEDNNVVLALTGLLRSVDGPTDLVVEEVVDDGGLTDWARVKLLGFADAENEPTPAALDNELAARRAESPIARYDLALLDDKPIAALAHYTASQDQMVFNLATRVPFRNRGVAQAMLQLWTERALAEGARSLLINCDEHGRPAGLYRRMGFTDEVYWHRRYQARRP